MGSMSSQPPRQAVNEALEETHRLWHAFAKEKPLDKGADGKDIPRPAPKDLDYHLALEDVTKLGKFILDKLSSPSTTAEAFAATAYSNVPTKEELKVAKAAIVTNKAKIAGELLGTLDTNKDGCVSYDEFHRKYPIWLKKFVLPTLKTAEEAKVVESEAAKAKALLAAKKAILQSQTSRVRFVFQEHDINHNESLERSEVKLLISDLFGDLRKSIAEHAPDKAEAIENQWKPLLEEKTKSLIDACDKNHMDADGKESKDGRLTWSEFHMGYSKWLQAELETQLAVDDAAVIALQKEEEDKNHAQREATNALIKEKKEKAAADSKAK